MREEYQKSLSAETIGASMYLVERSKVSGESEEDAIEMGCGLSAAAARIATTTVLGLLGMPKV